MKRRALGQHYLVDAGVAKRMVEYAGIAPSEKVLEIGTGKGALTKELTGLGASLEAFEVDEENYEETRRIAGSLAKIRLGDAFEHRPVFDVLVASLPYSESARFVGWLAGLAFDRAVVMLQRDFVKKLEAPPGTRDYRGVSALAQIAFRMEELEKVGRESFRPPPKVSSEVVRFRPRRRVSRGEASRIAQVFSLRRRRAGMVLRHFGLLSGSVSLEQRRVYELKPEEVHAICAGV